MKTQIELKLKRTLMIAAVLFVSAVTLAEGTSHGGGGSLFLTQPGAQPILVDYLKTAPHFQDSFQIAPTKPLEVSEYAKALGYDYVKLEDIPTSEIVRQRLEMWRSEGGPLITFLEKSLNQNILRVTPRILGDTDSYVLPENIKSKYPQGKVVTSIIYTKEFGAWISIPVWNRLGDYTQAGLLLHEAIRQMQNDWGVTIPNSTMQDLVAQIMLTSPSKANKIDGASIIAGPLKKYFGKSGAKTSETEFFTDCSEVILISQNESTSDKLKSSLQSAWSYSCKSSEYYALPKELREFRRESFYRSIYRGFNNTGLGTVYQAITRDIKSTEMRSTFLKACKDLAKLTSKSQLLKEAHADNCITGFDQSNIHALISATRTGAGNFETPAELESIKLNHRFLDLEGMIISGNVSQATFEYYSVSRNLGNVLTSVLEKEIKDLIDQNPVETFFKSIVGKSSVSAKIALKKLKSLNEELMQNQVNPLD